MTERVTKRVTGFDAAARATGIYPQLLADYEQPAMDEAMRAELDELVTRRRTELGD